MNVLTIQTPYTRFTKNYENEQQIRPSNNGRNFTVGTDVMPERCSTHRVGYTTSETPCSKYRLMAAVRCDVYKENTASTSNGHCIICHLIRTK
jgi:hypothetical protein